jgi:hypothetical protein
MPCVNNKQGKYEKAGTMLVDLTILKTRKDVQPIIPGPRNKNGQKPHYKVDFEIVIEVIDRNLYFHAQWPIGDDNGEILGSRRKISIASAFTPGTK